MPPNFDDVLVINDHGCLTPAGPLVLAADETVVRLDAWVWQDGGACIAVQRNFPDRNRWTITTDPDQNHSGAMFQPGAATAMGLMVSTKGGQTKTFQWTEGITLVGNK
jgi:hypothetical protein